MHIWMLKTGEDWPLEQGNRLGRTGQLARMLISRGHQVTWWTSGFEHRTKSFRGHGEWDCDNGLRVIAMNAMPYRRNISLRRYANQLQLSRVFTRMAARRDPPDLIVASLPCHHLALAGVRYARKSRRPVVVDYRDRWPDVFSAALDAIPATLRRLLLSWDFHVQRQAFAMADAIIGISPGYVREALQRAGRAQGLADHHFYLGSKPVSRKALPLPDKLAPFAERKFLVYAGTFGRSYDLRLVVEAARRLASERDDFVLVLCGSGEQAVNSVIERHPAAITTGWLGVDELGSVLVRCRAGLMPFYEGVPQSVPNKAFDYLAAGLPLISTLEGEMHELVRARSLGINCAPGDVGMMVDAMRTMLADDAAHEAWASNARRFFEEEGDVNHIYEKYAEHLEQIASRRDR